ncbi:MAG TPA: isoprenyl transferase [Bacillota bacterium]|nr:isoprenyl transferase [Bacillota bacterium]
MSMKFPFLNKQNRNEKIKTPTHVAIIMDGNGRWAKKRGLPRVAGHKKGMDVVKETVKMAIKCHVKILTLYAFSTENWKRPKAEVDFLMRLPNEFLDVFLPDLIKNNVRIDTIGNTNILPEHTQKAIAYAKEKTKQNNGLLLNFAINYGSRNEIIEATKSIMNDIKAEKISPENIDENIFSEYLYTNNLSDPDLLIRTSGEQRLSNFLLWQLAYTEFWFTDVYWPDFSGELFKQAIDEYKQRQRRYGGI